MNAEHPHPSDPGTPASADGLRPDLSNANVREDLALTGRCALVHLPSGRTCVLPLRHHGPCDFRGAAEATNIVSEGQ